MTKEQWINRCTELFKTYNSLEQTNESKIITDAYINELKQLYNYTGSNDTQSNIKKYFQLQELWNQSI